MFFVSEKKRKKLCSLLVKNNEKIFCVFLLVVFISGLGLGYIQGYILFVSGQIFFRVFLLMDR